MAPSLIDRYEILEELGEGGYGSVYRARHQFQNREVALKVLHASDELERFLREAEILAQLRHPNIVESFDAGQTVDGKAFLALELLEGESLTDRLRNSGAQPPLEAAWIVDQVLAALEAAHAAGVIHRDVKPGNVFLAGKPPRVKLLDFGVSKILGASRLTGTGTYLGTPRYIPPEVLRGQPVDVRTDIYACGVLLYELLSGRPLFMGPANEVLVQKLAGPPLPVSSFPGGEDIPRSIEAIVDHALADWDDRYPTASAMRHALGTALAAERAPASPRVEPSGVFRLATGVLNNDDADPFADSTNHPLDDVPEVGAYGDETGEQTQVDGGLRLQLLERIRAESEGPGRASHPGMQSSPRMQSSPGMPAPGRANHPGMQSSPGMPAPGRASHPGMQSSPGMPAPGRTSHPGMQSSPGMPAPGRASHPGGRRHPGANASPPPGHSRGGGAPPTNAKSAPLLVGAAVVLLLGLAGAAALVMFSNRTADEVLAAGEEVAAELEGELGLGGPGGAGSPPPTGEADVERARERAAHAAMRAVVATAVVSSTLPAESVEHMTTRLETHVGLSGCGRGRVSVRVQSLGDSVSVQTVDPIPEFTADAERAQFMFCVRETIALELQQVGALGQGEATLSVSITPHAAEGAQRSVGDGHAAIHHVGNDGAGNNNAAASNKTRPAGLGVAGTPAVEPGVDVEMLSGDLSEASVARFSERLAERLVSATTCGPGEAELEIHGGPQAGAARSESGVSEGDFRFRVCAGVQARFVLRRYGPWEEGSARVRVAFHPSS